MIFKWYIEKKFLWNDDFKVFNVLKIKYIYLDFFFFVVVFLLSIVLYNIDINLFYFFNEI